MQPHVLTLLNLLHSPIQGKVVTETHHGLTFVAFRGTQNIEDVLHDLDVRPRRWPPYGVESPSKVHGGFAKMTEKTWDDVETILEFNDRIIFGGCRACHYIWHAVLCHIRLSTIVQEPTVGLENC